MSRDGSLPRAVDAEVSIRPLHAWNEYLAAEELQRVVWQMPDWRDVVPAHLLITAQKNGGLVLGAFEPDGRMVGLVFGFLGAELVAGKLKTKHCSHMLAVLPEYQSRQIGARFKLAQRAAVLAQGIDLITWTYDPLQALNAKLNLVRLGALARHYIPDAYGEMTDGLNVGLASDRFQVEWWLNAPRVRACAEGRPARPDWDALAQAGARAVFEIAFDAHLPRIVQEHDLRGDCLLVEIPARLNALKAAAPDLARAWRSHTRALFTRAFAAGYVATGFVTATRAGEDRAAYVLTRTVEDLGT